MTRTVDLAVIPGDGIGPEVIAEALKALAAATAGGDLDIRQQHFRLGAERFLEDGQVLPADEFARIKQADAILFGAVGGVPGDPRLRGANIERGLLLELRFSLDHYVNHRPSRLVPGIDSVLASPGEVDFVVVREGTEGPYAGKGGVLRRGTPQEIASELSVNTAFGVERVVRYAFELARKRRGHLTWVAKTNVLVHAGGLWQRLVETVAEEYPDVAVDYQHIDAAMIHLVTRPSQYDVIVTDNLFGDILTDLAGAISGGIGLAASGNINPDGAFPSMFEPVHGSAPDIAGKQLADPTAAILSVALLLDHLGEPAAAARITAAVDADLAARGDATRSTAQIGDAIVARI